MLDIRKMASFVGLFAVGAMVATVARPGTAQGAGAAPVTVVNTPLPVQVTGTVNLATETIIPVASVDNPALQPFHLTFGEGAVTVPAGKTYVVEQYSANCDVDAIGSLTDAALRLEVGGALLATDHAVPHVRASNGFRNGSMVNLWVASATTRFYAPAGSLIFVSTSTNFNETGARSYCNFWATGYAVDTL